MIKVGVFGAGGRMGLTVCQTVVDAPDMDLVAAVDPHHSGIEIRQLGIQGPNIQVGGRSDAMEAAEVAVDFTQIEAARENLRWCAEHGVHAVVGTTGFGPDDFLEFERLFSRSDANAVIAPNFAIGAVLMMRFAEMAAPYFPTAEIVELHHDAKTDAPSGTAMLTAERMAAASDDWADDPTTYEVAEGARGGAGPGGIHIHSLRIRGMVAHQEVVLGTTGQSLTIRHDSYDRSSFMPGVLLAVRAVAERPGLTVGLDTLLGI
ncbi:MAG TPA: 4-hydroxy-tetrahydrodipicolinate reductase [Acidimicrobiia bacterium]|nr:4-hydroxy-tetrahydrodipicolinate reductase [Acidimicrobiia bacterium]